MPDNLSGSFGGEFAPRVFCFKEGQLVFLQDRPPASSVELVNLVTGKLEAVQ